MVERLDPVDGYEVVRRGEMELPRTRYVVLDYVFDLDALMAARIFASSLRSEGRTAWAEELSASLDGADEGATLRAFEVRAREVDGQEVTLHPASRFIALDVAHSYAARVALACYINKVKQRDADLAARLSQVRDDTMETYREYMESRNPVAKKSRKTSVRQRKRYTA